MIAGRVLRYLVAGPTSGTIDAVVGPGRDVVRDPTGIIDLAQDEPVTPGGTAAVTLHGLVPLLAAVVSVRPGGVARPRSA